MNPATPLTLDDWLACAPPEGDWSAVRAARERIAGTGRPVYLHVVDRAALEAQLRVLDERAAACAGPQAVRQAMPLFGVPFVVKDNIDIAGAPTTAACPAFEHTAATSASAVQRLMDAGAVWLAKTNLDQFATGLVGTRSPYGAPSSAWSAAHVSGGSSSGSAVAVALGHVPLALGTDTAGSGRVPAGFNHIVGLKPTPGRVSTAGVLPACRSIDCVSVFALLVEDAARALAVMEGPDAADPYTAYRPGPGHWPARLRLGVPAALPPDTDAAVATAFGTACAQARALGHTLVPLDFDTLDAVAALLYEGPWVAERFTVVGPLLETRPDAVDPTVAAVIGRATGFSAADAFLGAYRLRELAPQAAAVWERCDALLVPTTTAHPTHADLAADPIGANARLGRYTNFVNLLGWCALSVPASVTETGLPFGVTFIAPGGHDAALARFAIEWQAVVAQPLGATGAPHRTVAARGPWPAQAPTLPLAVVGAHLSGLPLNWQLTEAGAVLRERTRTAPLYTLHALAGTVPPKPGLLRVPDGGAAIELEVWDLPMAQVGAFLARIPAPLGLGTLTLEDGRTVHGFLCEAHALAGALDITRFGGWRAYLASLQPGAAA